MAKSSYVSSGAKIKVIGTGGGGCNAVSRMVREHLRGVEFIAMNTDSQALEVTEAMQRFQLGEKATRGLGAGGDCLIGKKAAEESRDAIAEVVAGADMVFITAGMGGGTGTGSAPIIAEMAKKSGALTIAVVTKPFVFEGTHRNKTAEEGIKTLMQNVDTLIIIPNDRLLDLCDQKMSVDGAFRLADEVLHHGVQAIAEVITVPGLINLDFADVRVIMKDAGPAWMSIGRGTGQNRAIDAAKDALASPLLDVSVHGAKGVLFNIAGSSLTLLEVNDAAEVIRQAVDPQANVIFGVVLDPNMGNDVRLTLVATGFQSVQEMSGDIREKELTRLLKGIGEDELDTPSFARQRSAYQQLRTSPGRRN
jgi:cell division protein FtsZ